MEPIKLSIEQQQQVEQSLSLVEGVIQCQRISEPTPQQIQYSIQRAIEMAQQFEADKYLIDARGTLPPTAELRQVLRLFLKNFVGHFEAMAVILDENPTLQVSTKFIFHKHDIPENMRFQVCQSIDEGMRFLNQPS